MEDTVWMEVHINQEAGIVTLKSITIPANTLKGHFRVFWNVSVFSQWGCNQGDIQTELRVNNFLVIGFLGTTGSPTHAGIGFIRSRSFGGNPNWVDDETMPIGGSYSPGGATIDATQSVEVRMLALSGDPDCNFILRVGSFIVEYSGQ